VKKCVSCVKDLPDAAAHCVHCGVAQPAVVAPVPEPNRTVMGYSAAEVRAAAEAAARQPAPVAPSMPAPMQAYVPPPAQPAMPPPPTAGQAPTMMAMSPPPGALPASIPMAPAMSPQPARSPLAATINPAHVPSHAPPGASYPFPPPPSAGPAPLAPLMPTPAPPPSARLTPPGLQGATLPMEAAGPATDRDPSPDQLRAQALQVQPLAVPQGQVQRPALGDIARVQTAPRRMTLRGTPVEPNRVALRVLLIIFGALLLGYFCVPVSTKPMAFNWDVLVAAPTTHALLETLWLVVGGAIAIVVALIPMPTVVRAVIALAIGLGAYGVQFGLGPTPEWQALAYTTGTLCMLVGLLLRQHYTESIGARLTTTVGALTVLSVFLVPTGGGGVPLIEAFKALGSNRTVDAILVIAPAVVALVSTLVWLGANTSAGAAWIAWTALIIPPLGTMFQLAGRSHVVKMIELQPTVLGVWLPPLAWNVLAAYGIAAMVAKKLER
jgi:hypothetical protein